MAKTKTIVSPLSPVVEKEMSEADPVAPARLPGDPMTQEEEQSAKDATLSTIKAEMEAERAAAVAHDRAMAAEYGKRGVQLRLPEDVTPEQRAKHHEESVALIQAEWRETQAQNPPRALPTGAGDQASIDLVKAEMARSRKRIVLR